MRIHFDGTVAAALELRSALEEVGAVVRIESGGIERRDTGDLGAFVVVWLISTAVDEVAGSPVRAAVRGSVEAVAREFQRRYPNITIHIEDPP